MDMKLLRTKNELHVLPIEVGFVVMVAITQFHLSVRMAVARMAQCHVEAFFTKPSNKGTKSLCEYFLTCNNNR